MLVVFKRRRDPETISLILNALYGIDPNSHNGIIVDQIYLAEILCGLKNYKNHSFFSFIYLFDVQASNIHARIIYNQLFLLLDMDVFVCFHCVFNFIDEIIIRKSIELQKMFRFIHQINNDSVFCTNR